MISRRWLPAWLGLMHTLCHNRAAPPNGARCLYRKSAS
jgi:hypothetical protein